MDDQLNQSNNDKYFGGDTVPDLGSGGGQPYSIENPGESHHHNGNNSNNSSGNFGAAAAAANGPSSAESEQMKIFVTNPNVTYHTRHARRIYVGGIPPNYSDEEELRNFFNKVISKGMDVENDNSYVISVYMNQKKCYAFVEFNSIELTTACLEMDGIIFKKVTLKIYRANEYRPELVPPTKYIKLDLAGWSFGLATGAGANGPAGQGQGQAPMLQQQASFMGRPDRNGNLNNNNNGNGNGLIAPHASWIVEDTMTTPAFQSETLASLIQFTNIASMEPGSLVIVGFPYEAAAPAPKPSNALGSPQRPQQRGAGSASAPTCLRKCLSAYPFGAIYNAELGIDLVLQPIVDVGDVLAGQSRGETKALLSTTVSELLLRGSVPFLIGGSRDQTYYSALGLVAAAGVCVGVMNVSAQVDSKILDCPEFCQPSAQMAPAHLRSSLSSPARNQNCYGRYVQFGAQGSQCNGDAARSIVDRGGHIFWLHKDLRTASTESVAVAQFTRALRNLDACVTHDQQRKGVNTAAMRASYPQAHMMVTVDCGVLAAAFNPHVGSSHSSVGLTAEEVLEIAFLAGAHPNVALFELTEFRPDVDSESRLNMFLADVFYKFTLGVASRSQPVRGGVLGSGASAVMAASAQQSAVNGVNNGNAGNNLIPQYNRPAGALPPNKSNGTGRIAVPYVPESTIPRYTPSRDPAVILQQQQAAQALQQAQQQEQLGRGPYTPQQLQVQQQQMLHAQNARAARGMLTPFPTIPENAAVNSLGNNNNNNSSTNGSHRPQLKHFGSGGGGAGSPFSLHEQSQQDDAHLAHSNANPSPSSNSNGIGAYEHADLRAQRNSLGSYADVIDDATLPAAYGSALLSRSGNSATARQASQSFTEGMYPNNNNNNNNTNNNNMRNNSNYANNNTNSHYQSSSPNQQHANININALNNLNNLSISPFYPPSHYTGATPTSNSSTLPYTASSDWLNPNLSRMSSHSTSTMSMLGAFHSTSSNLHTNSFSNSSHNLNNASFSLSTNYDDSMDKLIGVTNIGLVPAFDDPQDPLYHED